MNFIYSLHIRAIILTLFLSSHLLLIGQEINISKNPPVFSNSSIQFNASASSGQYSIFTDTQTPGQTLINSFNFNNSQFSYLPFVPGVYFGSVGSDNAAAVYDPWNIAPFTPKPDDFTAFWQNVYNELPDPNPVITNLNQGSALTTATLQLDNLNGKKIYCTLTYPSTGSEFSAILRINAYNALTNIVTPGNSLMDIISQQQNALVVSLAGISEVPLGASLPESPFTNEAPFLDDRAAYYYKNSVAACLQIFRYLESRPDYSASKGIGIFGESQGGGLGLLAAAADVMNNNNRVRCLMISQPALCDHGAVLNNRAAGFPNYIISGRQNGLEDNAVAAAASYYDAVHAASEIDLPVYFEIGYRDLVTPAHGHFAAINALRGPVHVIHSTSAQHTHGHDGFWGDANRIFYGRHLNNTEYTGDATVFTVDAEPAFGNANPGEAYNLTGSIRNNAVLESPSTLTAQWFCVDCPTEPDFTNQNTYETSVTFSSPGIYRLGFGPVSSFDDGADRRLLQNPNNSNIFYTAADYTTVVVGNTTNTTDNSADVTKIYPNPATSSLQIETSSLLQTLSIYDLQGKEIMSFKEINHSLFSINTTSLPSGTYWLRGLTTTGTFVQKCLIAD